MSECSLWSFRPISASAAIPTGDPVQPSEAEWAGGHKPVATAEALFPHSGSDGRQHEKSDRQEVCDRGRKHEGVCYEGYREGWIRG